MMDDDKLTNVSLIEYKNFSVIISSETFSYENMSVSRRHVCVCVCVCPPARCVCIFYYYEADKHT